MKKKYLKSKQAKVGDKCVCPSCNTEFIKEHYQQTFCKTKPGTQCKDKYWNTVTPNKKNNTTRISPASKRWLGAREIDNEAEEYEGAENLSGDALGQWID